MGFVPFELSYEFLAEEADVGERAAVGDEAHWPGLPD
jgi:hypothetical protein